jgi:hypothetical protein
MALHADEDGESFWPRWPVMVDAAGAEAKPERAEGGTSAVRAAVCRVQSSDGKLVLRWGAWQKGR